MKKPSKKLAASIITGFVIGGLLAGATAFAKISIHGKFSPKTHIAYTDISYKTPEEAKALLKPKVEDYYKSGITFQFQGKSVEISPADLSVDVLWEDTVNVLKKADASEMTVFDLLAIGGIEDKNLGVLVNIDSEKMITKIEEALNFDSLKPKPASFYFENGKLEIQEEKNGIIIMEDALLEEIKNSAKQLRPNIIEVQTEEMAAKITKEDLELQKEDILSTLSYKVTLGDPIYRDDWKLSLKDHLDWVEFVEEQTIEVPYFKNIVVDHPIEGAQGKIRVAVKIKEEKLNEFIDAEISKWLDRPAEDVNIKYDEGGEIVIEGKGLDGRKVQRKIFKEAIELAVANKIPEITIPVIDIKSELNIDEQIQKIGIKERLSQGHTSYYGSPPNRVHNIKLGAAKFNGLIIQPDEEFSFNTSLGPVEEYTGYKKELVIKPEGTIPEYGGGICQVSTTMYRSILYGGLPVRDRRQHSYAVSYYSQVGGHGLDATIYIGGQDLKFFNDTGQPILIQTYTVDDYELYINFYGTSDGRSVKLVGPNIYNQTSPGGTEYIKTNRIGAGQTKNVGNAHGGFTADWEYTLIDAAGKATTETLHTVYKAVPQKIWVGEGTVLEESIQN